MYKKIKRRTFLDTSFKASLALPFLHPLLLSCQANDSQQSRGSQLNSKKLNILILGGTSFLGPNQIAYAMERGHKISTFTRGKTQPSIYQDLFENVESLIGDREDNLTALEGRKWDAVIDNSGRKVEWTKQTVELLKDNCGLYVYTSSTGVFYPYLGNDFKEEMEVLHAVPEEVNEGDKYIYDYGVMKANSEQEAIKGFGKDRAIIVRPTYMIGPADRTNRFIHWPLRLSKGGEVLVPGKKEDRVQYIDVRDIAEWMIRLIENKQTGIFNGVGPKGRKNIYDFVEEAKQAFNVNHTFVKIDDYDFLKTQNVEYIVPWIMPLGNNEGTAKINNEKAKAHGLTFRPVEQSVKDTYDWWNSEAVDEERRKAYGSNPDSILNREASIIEAWKGRKG